MIDAEGDKMIVHFDIAGSKRKIRMELSAYLALVKVSRNLEELRVNVFMWEEQRTGPLVHDQRKPAVRSAAAAGSGETAAAERDVALGRRGSIVA